MTPALLEQHNDFPSPAEDHGFDDHQQAKDPPPFFPDMLLKYYTYLSVSTQNNVIGGSKKMLCI